MKTNWICEIMAERAAKAPQGAFLFDGEVTEGLSNAKVLELSGRVYAYLKANGIGREDFVLINLPRGVKPLVAELGVWRAGAAFALVEDTYAPERIAFIRKDCGCKLEIDAAAWERILRTEPLDGCEQVGEHDAAFAIYTSGTTGTPKGVLHEYGNLRCMAESIALNGREVLPPDERFALVAPLNFVASLIAFLKLLTLGESRIHVVPYALLKTPPAFVAFMKDNRISLIFLTPSYVRTFGTKAFPTLKRLFVGSEPANGIAPADGLEVYNVYAMSESGFAVGVFRIDRAYDACPVGRPQIDRKVELLGEDGEFCFENPFVRGYINRPEETAKAFRDGLYHTGDLARQEPNGDFTVIGRASDMVKINGNRVEPAEVEAVAKEALGVSWCAVRGFEDDARAFLAAYYTDDVAVDADKVRAEMAKKLPYYMLPQHFVRIEKVPLLANGKLDRKRLPKPEAGASRAPYAAPANDAERALCAAMEKVLGCERVGAKDDFYEIGGDSLGAIRVVTECGLDGISAGEIFRGRTPARIAADYLGRRGGGADRDVDALDDAARLVPHRLTPEQLCMFDNQCFTPASTMYNLPPMFRLEKGLLEPAKLAEAVTKALRNHPALAMVLSFDADGEVVQTYTPGVIEDVTVERISEFDLNLLKEDLVRPYQIVGSRLYRCRLFETEKALYLFMDFHHIVFDGTSSTILLGDVMRAYAGKPLPRDYYCLAVRDLEESGKLALHAEAKRYFEGRYGGTAWTTRLTPDRELRENPSGVHQGAVRISADELKRLCGTYGASVNEIFNVIYALTFAVCENARDICLSWVYNGRDDARKLATVGLLFRILPIAFRFRDDMGFAEMVAEAGEQVAKGIGYASVSVYGANAASVVDNGIAALLCQNGMYEADAIPGLPLDPVPLPQRYAAAEAVMDTEIIRNPDGAYIYCTHYAARYYEEGTITRFFAVFDRICRMVAEHADGGTLTFGDIMEGMK